ncbi:hypothetical protein PK28_02365 [Hymenobacter sp. DG25B]|uniref:hypothetical protein n=1 Tax=Hymenobacter sp. DG25B TaxID=1385664 RepID=UPI000540B151|nr:hypothetical protein [Hymenobacter sp. DG25B]AIZ62815.1 hypothetical protein PK28_02365 [Hymenobacter sp. DG25B]
MKNNIFANTGSGYATYLVSSPSGTNDWDYNNYYSASGKLGFTNGTAVADLAQWRKANSLDNNSKAVNPFYTSPTNLSINQILLNSAAMAITGITTDIDGATRGSTADIGAKEFTPCTPDVGVNAFVGLGNPLTPGSQSVQVQLQNQSLTALNSAVINWSINGASQPVYKWTGSLTGAANASISLGNFNFQGGKSYSIKAWATTPNGQKACNALNDTASIKDLATPLCGLYTIGGTNPDFQNFTEAVTALNNAGVGCGVTFRVRNGSYNEQVKLGQISGASATAPIVFESESGDSTKVALHYQETNPSNDYTLVLEGTDYITFRKLGILRSNGQSGSSAVIIRNGAHHVSFRNTQLNRVSSPGTSCDSVLTFAGNAVTGGIFLANLSTQPASRVAITGNTFTSPYSASESSIGLSYTTGALVQGNTVAPSINSGSEVTSVNVTNSSNPKINNNHLFAYGYYSTYGVIVSSTVNAEISDNTIQGGCYSSSGYSSYGIQVRGVAA